MRIDFYEDECAKPLPKIRRSATAVPKAPKKVQSPVYNPFELLSQDEFEMADDEDDDEDEDEDNEI